MLSRVALPVLMWSISAVGGEEPPADQPVIELEVVTVTATKSAFEVPASVSIIGPEHIEAEQPQSIDDLPEELPNVEVVSGPRRISETANIRGSGCRAQRFRDRARVPRIALLRGHELQTRGYSGLRFDFGIDTLTNKPYRRHLSLIDEAGRNFKVSVSYRF